MATLDDIASAVGVSRSTVSRVLNGRATPIGISTTTRERILAAARELHYHPNLFARGLRWKRSSVIGLIIKDFTYPFWNGIIKGINETCAERGYHVILSDATDDDRGLEKASTLLGQLGVDGIILGGSPNVDRSGVLRLIERCRNVVGVTSRNVDPDLVPYFKVDDDLGMQLLLEHLLALGHRRVGFVGLIRSGSFTARYDSYRRILAEHGLPYSNGVVDMVDMEKHFPSTDEFLELGAAMTRRVLATGEPIDALVAACDSLAVGALQAAHAMGLQVPRDLSIAGFDDAPLARYCIPPLTTIRQPVVEMGRRAASLLIDKIEGKDEPCGQALILPPEGLIARGSTAPVRVRSTS